MRSATAKKLLRDYRAYDREREKRMKKLEETLSDTLQDLQNLNTAIRRRRPRA